jgi:putative transcriptional regulator
MRHEGRLLVATPLIGDPNFERTVILLVAHSGDGALGVVLNRPSGTPVAEVLPEWADAVVAPGVVFVGGPVNTHSVMGLGHCGAGGYPQAVSPGEGFEPMASGYGTVDLHRPPAAELVRLGLRLFAGSAGWAAGQLEDEISDGAWWPVDAVPDDLTCSDPGSLWNEVLRRQPGEVAWFANHPVDPSLN